MVFKKDRTFTRGQSPAPDAISDTNLGAIFGGLDHKFVKRLLDVAKENPQQFDFSRNHRLIIRKIRDGIIQVFDHIQLKDSQLIIKGLLKKYIELDYEGREYFIMNLLTTIDDYTNFGVLNERVISEEKFDRSNKYLYDLRTKTKSFEKLSAYFNLLTNIYISGEQNFGFTDSSKFDDFKQKITNLAYETLTDPDNQMIKKTHTSKKRFEAICLTLTALTNLRYHIPSIFPLSKSNPKAYYTLSELSAEISPYDNKMLLSQQLKSGAPSPQLYNIIKLLNIGIDNNKDGCSLAKHKIELYLKSKQWTTQEFGFIFHPIYQQFSIEYLGLFDIRTAHENYVTHLEDTRVDITIERKSDAERRSGTKSNFEVYIEDRQNVLTIPDEINLITVDVTYVSDWATLKEKLDKHYQSDDRLLIIVLVGQKSDRTIQKLNKKLQEAIEDDDGSKHLENVRIISSEQYGEFLGLEFDRDYERVYEEIQEATFNIFQDANTLFGAMDLKRRAQWWLQQHKAYEDWINIYIPQRRS